MELTKNTLSHCQLSCKLGKKNCKLTYLNLKGNTKEHTEEALLNFSCDNVVLSFVDFVASMKILAPIRL